MGELKLSSCGNVRREASLLTNLRVVLFVVSGSFRTKPCHEPDSLSRLVTSKMTGEWLANCAACPVPEIANVFNRCRIPFHQVTGMLDNDPACWREVDEWVEAARVAHTMEHNRMGV